jgi:hypothetical protein
VKLVWSLIAGLGGLFFAVGLVLLAVDLRFFADAHRTEGEVIDLRFNSKGSGAPDVAYADHLGRDHVHRSNIFSRPSYRIGDRVTIAYDPDEPDDAAIDSPTNRWLLPGIFGGIGFVHLGIGLREGQRVSAKRIAPRRPQHRCFCSRRLDSHASAKRSAPADLDLDAPRRPRPRAHRSSLSSPAVQRPSLA